MHSSGEMAKKLRERLEPSFIELEAISEETVTTRVTYMNSVTKKNEIESQLRTQEHRASMLERHISDEIVSFSKQQLQLIFDYMHRKLPLELRERIYMYMIEYDGKVLRGTTTQPMFQGFNGERYLGDDFYFDQRVVPTKFIKEIITFFTRTITIYSLADYTNPITCDINHLLHIRLPFDRSLGELVRNLGILIRCDEFRTQVRNLQDEVPGILKHDDSFKNHGELFALERYRSMIRGLKDLPYHQHPIKLAMCICFRPNDFAITPPYTNHALRVRYNLLEVVKEVYFSAKDAGASATVRIETFDNKEALDVTWELDLDAANWAQRLQPIYHFEAQLEPPPARKTWLDAIGAAKKAGQQNVVAEGINLTNLLLDGGDRGRPDESMFDGGFAGGIDCTWDFDSFLRQPGDVDAFQSLDFDFDFNSVETGADL